MILLVSELLRGWRPGSLILIDEPELHLHTAWQLRLWDLLRQLRTERGGQVILTTQSSDLFEVADHRSMLLLGGALR
jgi:predicted ATP-dependent endonuclease of OLD family